MTLLNEFNDRVFGYDITNLANLTTLAQQQSHIINKKEGSSIQTIQGKNSKIKLNTNRKNEQSQNVSYGDPQIIPYYHEEIYNYLLMHDSCSRINANYMQEVQKDLNEKMRAILIDWLVGVHEKFQLNPETLFSSINILDKFLEKKGIPRQKLQLVGITSLLIASKLEEIYYPDLIDLVAITDFTYQRKNIIDMENDICFALNFEFSFVNIKIVYDFLVMKEKFDEKMKIFGYYLLELCLLEYKMLKFSCKETALAAISLVKKIFQKEDSDEILKEKDKKIMQNLHFILINQEKTKLKAVAAKYSQEKFFSVANIKIF